MDTVLDRPKTSWVKPTRKLTEAEIEKILADWEYDPDYDGEYDEYNEDGLPLISDEFGNPTYGTLEAMYETRNNLCREVTLEELFAPYEED